jgi:hypothetical protein
MGLHASVFQPAMSLPSPFVIPAEIHGKAILFACAPFTFPSDGPWRESLDNDWDLRHGPAFADIPWPGSRIEAGHPILTFFARGRTLAQCEEGLRETAEKLDRWHLER